MGGYKYVLVTVLIAMVVYKDAWLPQSWRSSLLLLSSLQARPPEPVTPVTPAPPTTPTPEPVVATVAPSEPRLQHPQPLRNPNLWFSGNIQ
ncbi:MAG: hypothetical protein R3E08_03435 [Thiotrichaceae bacterium]